MDKPHQVMPDVEVIPAHFPIPGMGFLPVNAFVIKAREPVLVDTGIGIQSEEFMKALSSIIDPQDLRWVLITHDDTDHTGSLQKVLEASPGARLAANSLAVLRMSAAWPLPMHRVYWLNPGDSINVGDRELTAVRPPIFDNPSTIGIYDNKSEAFFSADFFGAIIPSPVEDADDVTKGDLANCVISWASADSPWVHMINPDGFIKALDRISSNEPESNLLGTLATSAGKDRTVVGVACRSSQFDPLCCSRPDGPGAYTDADGKRPLITLQPRGIGGRPPDIMNDDYALLTFDGTNRKWLITLLRKVQLCSLRPE